MNKRKPYTTLFYKTIQDGSVGSAKEIIPIVIDALNPKSVIDFGCGVGAWLSVFIEHGINNILGIDGDWVDEASLLIPSDKFMTFNLENLENKYLNNRVFDLALCLEVAEHLPENKAPLLVDNLTSSSSVILFSAAIPYQGGTNHYNEQWLSYWIKLFNNKGYKEVDLLRPLIWDNVNIMPWYKQNIIIFCKDSCILDKLLDIRNKSNYVLSLVHPSIYLWKCNTHSFKELFIIGIRRVFSYFISQFNI